MNRKLWTKMLATMLVMTLTLTNFILLGVYASDSYGASDNLERQETVTNNPNVTFDAYFKDNQGNAIHSIKENMNREDLKLFVAVEVKKGYLKNASLQVLGENKTDANLKLKNSNEELEYIESIDELANTIHLKQINSGTQVILEVPVKADKSEVYDVSNFSKQNDIVLTGSYIGDAGTETKIQKTIQVRNEWKEEATPILEQQLLRFIPYQVNTKSGTILQTLVKSGIQNNTLPIEETSVVIEAPVINGKKPTDVMVNANGILVTNGKTVLSKEEWQYNKETGIINITIKNEPVQNKVSWLKQGQDELVVTYVYDEKIDTIETIVKAGSSIKAYNTVETQPSTKHELTISRQEVLGQIVLGGIQTTESLSKGYLYTKANKETSYTENVEVDVSYPELVDGFTVKQDMDYFVNEQEELAPTTIGNKNNTYYKTTKISKENFISLLGEEGSIKIVTLDGEEITTFNKESNVDENGDYVVNYEKEVNQIAIIASKPVEVGKLLLRHEKALKGSTDYSKNQVESFKALRVKTVVEAKAGDIIISNAEAQKDIALIAPTTKIEARISNANLSTVVKNENVELRVILKTNDITCDLYKNPVVEIVLPSYIEKVELKDVNLLFDNELAIKTYDTFVNENGNTVIRVTIEGEQTTYSGDEITKGANLIINTDITLKQLTPTTDDVMKVYVANELATSYEQTETQKARRMVARNGDISGQKGYYETSLKAVAPVGMVTTNTILGYNEKNETVTSISSMEQTGKLDVKKETRTATVRMNVINNYQNTVNQVSILGRVPTKGSKNADTLEDFGSNLTTTMANGVNVSGVDASFIEVYYTVKEDATKDLTLASNAWTKTPESFANVKSYLIVVKGDIQTGTTLDISYPITIPENLGYNLQAYSNYVVYYNNVTKERTITEKAVATKVGITTGDGPELEVTIHSDKEGQEVQEGQIITYTIQVKNVGKSEVKHVTLLGNIPEKTVYTYLVGEGDEGTERVYDNQIKSYSQVIESLPAGETKTFTYEVKTADLYVEYDEDGNISKVEDCTIQNIAKATVQGNDIEFTSNTLENKLVQGYINIEMNVEVIPEYYIRAEGDEITYAIYVENVNSLVKKNVTVTTTLPEGVTYIGALPKAQYDEKTRQLTWNIETLTANATKRFQFGVTVDPLSGNTYEKVMKAKATVIGEKQIESNETSITVQKASLTIKQTTDTQSTVSQGDTITYNLEIKNTGMGDAVDVEVVDKLPEELKYDSVQYSYNGKTYEAKLGSANTAKIRIGGLTGGQTLSVAIKAVVQSLDKGVKQKEVVNTASVTADGIDELISNEIKHTIVAKPDSNIDDPSTGDNVDGTYRISGIAWEDQNQDGKRDEEEQKLAGIPVILLHAENGNIVKDIVTGKDKKQETNEYGEYAFSNLNPGKYMVIFLYDSGKYGITNYKQAGVNDNQNSDAVQVNAVYEGVTRIAGASDTLSINNENMTNIDIGLVLSPKFDLKLEKVISRITVSDVNGTDVYDYKDEKVAKLDLNRKTAVGSSIMVEYKIKVTNEGAVPGYAKKIVDYMPNDMKFTSELNKDWYTSNNGTNLYNASLANTLINPGETKEVTLLLTKKITESNMGIVNNTAEIAESSNDLGIADVDSTPANKVQNEDDMSSADVIIGTKTGEVYMYMVLTLIVVGMLGTGIFLIKKKVIGSK